MRTDAFCPLTLEAKDKNKEKSKILNIRYFAILFRLDKVCEISQFDDDTAMVGLAKKVALG